MAKRGQYRPLASARTAVSPTSGGTLALAVIFIAALALRVLYILSIRNAPFFQHLQTEPLHYHRWATLILDGPIAPSPPFEQAPGYPYFVAAVYGLFGRSVTAVALVQAVLDAGTCVLIAVASRAWFGPLAGLVAGLFAAAYGPFIYFAGEMLPSTLFVFVAMLALTASRCRTAVHRAQRSVPVPWHLAAWLWGLAFIVRAETVLAWPFVLLDAWQRGRRRGLSRTAVPLLLVVAAFVAINATSAHKLVLLTTSGGVNLWLGNNPYADGVNPFISGPLVATERAVRARAADAAEADRMFRKRAVAFWRQHPSQAARLLWKKFVWTWTDRELPNSSDIDWRTAHSWLFRLPLFPLSFGAVLPLALAGALLFGRRCRELTLLGSLLAVGTGTSLLFFTNGRFRLIMVPALLILAGAGVEQMRRILPAWRQQGAALGAAVLGVALGLVGAWGNFYDVRTYRIPEISVNTGALEREAGHLSAAVHHLRQGLAGNPQDTIGWIHLALALEQDGQLRAALHAYLDALVLMPTDPTLRQMAGRFCERYHIDPALLQTYASTAGEAARRAVAERALQALRHPARQGRVTPGKKNPGKVPLRPHGKGAELSPLGAVIP
ncbi:MAG: glycosyltransferase family 39 protein [Candidatus Binatia bacterium]